ncbi:DUF1016 N-terminal domain-containing protein [Arthrobacter sp. GAS37]|uniref:DUF1016 N-terminal domain-containing protein n=1 Tax=Arthrobacter sp. GAS37 TaxID=3156261 RepID=UPI00384E5F65
MVHRQDHPGTQATEGWGSGVIGRLAEDLGAEFPDMKGLSRSNLQYMSSFAEACPAFDPNVLQPVGHLPWGYIRTILDKRLEPLARDWYAAAVQHGWFRNMLMNNTLEREVVVLGESHAEAHADVTGIQGGAHEAFLWPDAQGVADETEDIGRGFDGERFHDLSPSEAASAVGVSFRRRSDRGFTAGHEGPECNLGNRERSKSSRGKKRSAERSFGSGPAQGALVARRARPAMIEHQNDKQRRVGPVSCHPGACCVNTGAPHPVPKPPQAELHTNPGSAFSAARRSVSKSWCFESHAMQDKAAWGYESER